MNLEERTMMRKGSVSRRKTKDDSTYQDFGALKRQDVELDSLEMSLLPNTGSKMMQTEEVLK